eukprot:215501_1
MTEANTTITTEDLTTEQKEEYLSASHIFACLESQLNWKDRLPPRAPGFLPTTVDTIVNQCLQLGLTATDVLVILMSIAYDGDDKEAIIIASILILLIGFAFYIKYICKHILIWDTFFRKIDGWYARQNEKAKHDDHCRRIVFINVVWWVYAVLAFGPIICYSAWSCFRWYRNRRSDTNTDLTTIDADSNRVFDVAELDQYMKHAFNTFSVSYLGLLTKQASYWMLPLQDIPLLIICCVIDCDFGVVVFSCVIAYKVVGMIKYVYDVPGCGLIPQYKDLWDHFDLCTVDWCTIEDTDVKVPVPIYKSDYQKYKNRLRVGDYVNVIDKEVVDKGGIVSDPKIYVVHKNVYNNKQENLIVFDWDEIDQTAYDNGEECAVPEALLRLNRWDDDHGVSPISMENLKKLQDAVIRRLEDAKVGNSGKTDDVPNDTKPIQITIQKHSPHRPQTETNSMKTESKENGNTSKETVESVVSNAIESSDKVEGDSEEEQLMGDDVVIVDKNEKDGYEYQSVALNDNDELDDVDAVGNDA